MKMKFLTSIFLGCMLLLPPATKAANDPNQVLLIKAEQSDATARTQLRPAVNAAVATAKVGMPVARARTASLAIPVADLVARVQKRPGQPATARLELFADVTVELLDLELRRADGRQVLTGRTQPGAGRAYLVIDDQSVTGVIRIGATHYDLRPHAGGILISEISERSYRKEAPPSPAARPRPRRASAVKAAPAGAGAAAAALKAAAALAAAPIHDVLVLYTQDVEARLGGAAGAASRIALAIAMANDVYEQGGMAQRLRLAHAARVTYAETGDIGRDLDRLQGTNDGSLDEIHPLRDRHAADLVVLLVANGGNFCGKANLAVISSDADDDSAFAVVDESCIGNHTFAHELGHVSGAHHDAWADPTPLPAHAHGFVSVRTRRDPQTERITCEPSVQPEWRTVMAYDDKCAFCGLSCPRTESFSNPNRTHPDGRPLGGDGANNTRRLDETAITLESFRIGGPRISLYEGNRGTQDHVCVIPVAADEAIDFTSSADFRFCDNDEARSLRLFDVPAGHVIRLYDDPRGDTEDDWVEIVAKRALADKLIPTFEQSFEDTDVRVVYHRKNGLDGKVSRATASSTATGPLVELYEGDNATQDMVCALPAGQAATVRFPGHGRCENDEARSLVLRDIQAGTSIRLFDDPGGSRGDDWLEIEVLRDVRERVIGSLERSFSDADLRVVYRRHNGLAGKVSRLEIGAVAAGPRIELHEGNRGTQDTVCMITAAPALGIDFTRGGGGCANDKARSLTLHAVPAGTLLLLFDSPTGNREDDWVAIEVKRAITRKTIDSFERTFEDADVRVVYLRNNGLDGKLSRLEFTSAAALQGVISFHEGNDGRQNKVCDLTPTAQIVRFKSHAACDNDEARSVVLTQLAPGTRIDIFDNPDCRTNDDWTSIDVRRPVFRKTIGSFQRTFQDDDVTVAYHRENGLDGKVSCVRIQR